MLCITVQIPLDCTVKLHYVDSETLTSKAVAKELSGVDAVLVPGGFGERGVEGKCASSMLVKIRCLSLGFVWGCNGGH